MAQRVFVEMVDDLDGGAADQTVPFSLDGVSYEIDLSNDNAAALRDELARFVVASRRAGGHKVRIALGQSVSGTRTASRADRDRPREIRAWAMNNGYTLAERGRIPFDVIDAYERAQREPQTGPASGTGTASAAAAGACAEEIPPSPARSSSATIARRRSSSSSASRSSPGPRAQRL